MKVIEILENRSQKLSRAKVLLQNIGWKDMEEKFCPHCAFDEEGNGSCLLRPIVQRKKKCAEGLFTWLYSES